MTLTLPITYKAVCIVLENNSLAGDKARESVKESTEYWKEKVRKTMGENTASQLTNGLLNLVSGTGDGAILAADTVFDVTAALAACATENPYSTQAKEDLAKKDKAASQTLTSLINGNAWNNVKNGAIKAAQGDQQALENLAGIITGALIPGKIVSSGGKAGGETGTVPKGSKPSAESGNGPGANKSPEWTAGNDEFSQKPNGTVTNVEHPDGKYDGNSLPYKDKIGTIADSKDYTDILSPEAKQHILYGDSPTSGGHIFPGNPGKTTFPSNWTAEKIVHEIGDIATSPSTQWYAQTGTGGLYTSKGDPAKWVAYEVRDGVRLRVVYQPATGKVITAFPDKKPIPAQSKPIKKQ